MIKINYNKKKRKKLRKKEEPKRLIHR